MPAAPPLPDLAHDWLQARALVAGSATGNPDKARRQNLARWGRLLRQLTGAAVDDTQPFDIDTDLAGLTTRTLSVDHLIDALEQLRRTYKASTLQRMCSTLRGFCRWFVSRGHLASNPWDDEIMHITYRTEAEVRAFTPEDVAGLIDAATAPAAATSAWPTRDAAIIDLLAHVGVRAAECCALQIGDIGSTDRPLLHIRRGPKGNRRREVPLPRHTRTRITAYLEERAARGMRMGPRTELFVRNNGTALSTDVLYHLVKRLALAAQVTLPDDASVHGLRHHYGVQLAIRGVPPATLQQLMGHTDPRTTAPYTGHASRDLINALDDAGWLRNP